MPLLNFRADSRSSAQISKPASETFEAKGWSRRETGLLSHCANPQCGSGWLQIFRKRSKPVFEGGWTCSPECTEARIQSALHRELGGQTRNEKGRRHRIPLGLLMLEKGWITPQHLRNAVEAQRSHGTGRLGEWLIKQHATEEVTVTRALGLQWSCPVLWPDSRLSPSLTTIMPRLFLEAFGVLPLRVVADAILYLGFEESLDPVLALAAERMTGFRVESGIVQSSIFKPALAGLLQSEFPSVQICEAVSESAAAHLLARAVERVEPVDARLVRVHDCLWMRMFISHEGPGLETVSAVRDVVCTINRV
jgi:hypothetical protein